MTPRSDGGGPRKGSAAAFWLTLLACLAVMVLRDLPGALAPPVRLEDGTEMLAFFWRDPDPARIFRFYNGYISLGPAAVGYLAGQLPGIAAPYLLHWAALAMAAATFAALQIRDVALFDLAPREKAIIALVLVLLPLGNWALVTVTAYMLWSMLIFSTLLVLFWVPRPGPGALTLFALLIVFIWSHPLSILLAPALVVRLCFARTWFTLVGFAILLVSIAAYLALGIDVDGRPKDIDTGGSVALATETLRMFLSRGVAEPLISSRARAALAHWGLVDLTVLLGTLILAAAGATAWRWRGHLNRRTVWQIAALWLYGGLYTAASAASGLSPLEAPWGQRYAYPAAIFLLIPALWAAMRGLQALPHRPMAGAGVALVWLALVNVLDWRYYTSRPIDRAGIMELVATAAKMSADEVPYCATLDRGNWTIRLSEAWPEAQPCRAIVPRRD